MHAVSEIITRQAEVRMKQKFAGPDLSFYQKSTGPPLSKFMVLIHHTRAKCEVHIPFFTDPYPIFICCANGPKMNKVHLKEYFSKVSGMGDQEKNGI